METTAARAPSGPDRGDDVELVVLVATTGDAARVAPLLASLEAQRPRPRLAAVVLVENGPGRARAPRAASAVREWAGRLPLVHLSHERANKSAALNHGLRWVRRAHGHALVYMTDDDATLAPDVLAAFARAAARARTGRFFGGPVEPAFEDPPAGWLRELLPRSARGFDLGADALDVDDVSFLGPNWAAWASDLVAAGGFRTDRGPGTDTTGQESEMMRALYRLGLRGRWVPGAVVRHVVPASHCRPEWLVARARRHARESALVARGAPKEALRRLTRRAAQVPVEILRWVGGALARDEREQVRRRVNVARDSAFVLRLGRLLAQDAVGWRPPSDRDDEVSDGDVVGAVTAATFERDEAPARPVDR